MKLRMEHNSIRLRLRKSELEILAEKGILSERVTFNEYSYLEYILIIEDTPPSVEADFEADLITVSLPKSMADMWLHSDQVGIEQTTSNGLHILIEKDFPCKDRFDEDKSDLFGELAGKSSDIC
jgi:hypothetical protein